MATTHITLDVTKVSDLSKSIGQITGEALGVASVTAINDVLDRSYDLARTRMTAGINLTDDYVRRNMRVEPATTRSPSGSIVAVGGPAGTTTLSHYMPQQLVQQVNWSNARIAALGVPFGPWPGWTKRVGSSALGIQPNLKAKGVSVEVGRGRRRPIGPAFSIPGKKDSEGNYLVFRRTAAGKIEALLGPSVYQLFSYQIPLISNEVTDDLATTLAEYAEAQLDKALQ